MSSLAVSYRRSRVSVLSLRLPSALSSLERAVTFGEASCDAHAAIDAAYHAKYDRYGPNIVGHVVGSDAKAVTVRLVPAPEGG